MYALSADPVTNGHAWVLEEAMDRYSERVLFGIANDSKKRYAFAQWERLRLAQKSLGIPPEDVRLVPGSLAQYLMREDIPVLVRGSRNTLDDAAETTLRFYYQRENPDLVFDTVRAEPNSVYAEVSSSGVKESLRVGHDISGFVSSAVKQALESRIVGQYPVCITGEMGSGKSTLSKEIAKAAYGLGIPCTHVELDTIAHEIYSSLTDPVYVKCRKQVATTFGPSVVLPDGFIYRTALAAIVRGDDAKMESLNAIVRRPMMLRYGDLIQNKKGLILADAALLAEFKLGRLGNHHVVMVTADTETRTDRIIARYARAGREMTRADAAEMFARQMDFKGKKRAFEIGISEANNGSIVEISNGRHDGVAEDAAKNALFEILKNVDVFGELRAALILRMIGMSDIDADATVAELKKRHEEPHRFYHTWEHIVELLDRLFEYHASGSLPDEDFAVLGAAILFHDSVYEVNRTYYPDNETRSASYARDVLLPRGVKPNRVNRVYAAVQSTGHASGRSEDFRDPVSDVLHDLDLAILAAKPERYALYVTDILAEFGIYPGAEFRQKRAEFLRGLLDKDDALFRTEYGRQKFLETARRNVTEELARIEAVR